MHLSNTPWVLRQLKRSLPVGYLRFNGAQSATNTHCLKCRSPLLLSRQLAYWPNSSRHVFFTFRKKSIAQLVTALPSSRHFRGSLSSALHNIYSWKVQVEVILLCNYFYSFNISKCSGLPVTRAWKCSYSHCFDIRRPCPYEKKQHGEQVPKDWFPGQSTPPLSAGWCRS